MDTVVIPHSSVREAIQTASALKLIIGADCQLNFQDYSLEIATGKVLNLLFLDFSNRPSDQIAPILPPQRVDRIILLSDADTHAMRAIEDDFRKSDGDYLSYHRYVIALTQLRYQAIAPHLIIDLARSNTVIYGNAQYERVTCLLYPDGVHRTVRVLIHLSNPLSPLEQWDRERYVTAAKIVRYCVVGIDSDLHEPQAVGGLDLAQLRSLFIERVKAPDNFINALVEAPNLTK